MTTPGSGRPGRALLAALAVALVVRLLWLFIGPDIPLRGDDKAYVALAQALMAGEGYTTLGQPIAHFMPGWPLLLALPLAALGILGGHLLLCLLSTSISLTAYLTARRLFSERAGLVAAWFAALFPPLIWYSKVLVSETPSAAALGLWALAAVIYFQEGGGPRRVALVGLLGGVLVLFRAEMLILAPMPFVARALAARGRAEFVQRLPRELAGALAASALTLLVLAPWVAYNQQRLGKPLLLTTAKGLALWMVSHDPPVSEVEHPTYLAAKARYKVAGDPVTTSERFEAEGRANIASHPGAYVRARVLNLPRFWFGHQTESIPDAGLGLKLLGLGSQSLLVLSALGGLLWYGRSRAHLIAWLIIGAKLAAHAPFVQASRFSLHLAPLLFCYGGALLAGLAAWAYRALARPRRANLGSAAMQGDSSP